MRVYDMVVDERRRMVGLLESLTPDQWQQQTMCDAWTVHQLAAHLTTYLRFGQLKIYAGLVLTAADVDRINLMLTKRASRQSPEQIVDTLRRHATSRTTIPRSGFDPVLTDIVLHDLDIRRPLGIPRTPVEARLRVAFNHLTATPSPGYPMGWRLHGLHAVATDTGWDRGEGALVRGTAEDLVLGLSGRPAAFEALEGDGVEVLRERVQAGPKANPITRIGRVFNVLVKPPPADRRSREAVA